MSRFRTLAAALFSPYRPVEPAAADRRLRTMMTPRRHGKTRDLSLIRALIGFVAGGGHR